MCALTANAITTTSSTSIVLYVCEISRSVYAGVATAADRGRPVGMLLRPIKWKAASYGKGLLGMSMTPRTFKVSVGLQLAGGVRYGDGARSNI